MRIAIDDKTGRINISRLCCYSMDVIIAGIKLGRQSHIEIVRDLTTKMNIEISGAIDDKTYTGSMFSLTPKDLLILRSLTAHVAANVQDGPHCEAAREIIEAIDIAMMTNPPRSFLWPTRL